MYNLGLIGNPLTHSFSKKYFESKFKKEKLLNFSYSLYPIENLENINEIIYLNKLSGLNVTRPYKKKIIKHLDIIDPIAHKIQSVNTVFINQKNNVKTGYNTDIIGFHELFKKISDRENLTTLIIGSGCTAKTISYYLFEKKIQHYIISRNPKKNMLNYSDINNIINDCKVIINTTPLGQYPYINKSPEIPYTKISNQHYCIDLTYNPSKSLFLNKCEIQGATISNGAEMLISQANASFKLWQKLLKKYNV